MTTSESRINWNSVRARLAQHQTQFGGAGSVDRYRLDDVFRQRARRLAKRRHLDATKTNGARILVFRLGNERFGIELAHVKQVFPRVAITPLPGACRLLLGVACLNGSLRSIVNTGALLDVSTTRSDSGYVVLFRASGKLLGMWAEAMESVCQIDLEQLTPVDDVASHPTGSFIRGTTDERILVLDAASLIEHVAEQRRQHSSTQ